jgi:alpha-maltose-1-phosphate synthase
VSDWDGYRDTVPEGDVGFRIPTVMPPAPHGCELADRYAADIDDYDHYAAFTSQLVAVDTAACAEAFAVLFRNPALRARFGAAARAHAAANFDWRHVIARYQALWAELAERRASAEESVPLPTMAIPPEAKEVAPAAVPAPRALALSHPSRADPFIAFHSYPTHMYLPTWRVSLVAGADEAALKERLASPLVDFVKPMLPAEDVLTGLLRHLTADPVPVTELLNKLPAAGRAAAFRSLAWLAKMDFVRLTPPPENGAAGLPD